MKIVLSALLALALLIPTSASSATRVKHKHFQTITYPLSITLPVSNYYTPSWRKHYPRKDKHTSNLG